MGNAHQPTQSVPLLMRDRSILVCCCRRLLWFSIGPKNELTCQAKLGFHQLKSSFEFFDHTRSSNNESERFRAISTHTKITNEMYPISKPSNLLASGMQTAKIARTLKRNRLRYFKLCTL